MKRKPPALKALLDTFQEIRDPRVARTRAHPLVNVLVMALFGAAAGCDGWDALALFAKERADFFATFLDMPKGTPSADTFRRVFEALDPQAFQEAFRRWIKTFLESLEGQTVVLDGKALCGAMVQAAKTGGGAFHLMHVWAVEQRLLLGQKAVVGAPGEIEAALELIKMLDLKGATVTGDANNCTAAITTAVTEAGGDFVLALKGNRGALHDHVRGLFDDAATTGYRGAKHFTSHDEAHGRIEYRTAHVLPLKELPRSKTQWSGVRTAIEVRRVRLADDLTVERAFYISSHAPDAEHLTRRIRNHWSIENELHHVLDVSFDEDRRRIHHENGAQNFALITRYALSLLKREPSKMSVAMKRRRATMSSSYLLSLFVGGFPEF